MPHAATNIITVSPLLASNACYHIPSSSNLFEQYKLAFRNRLVALFDLAAIFIALIKFERQPVCVRPAFVGCVA